jgi:hypothetical protein
LNRRPNVFSGVQVMGEKLCANFSVLILSRICVWLSTGFWIGYWIYWHSYTRLGTTSNYSALADLHTLQITTAHAKPVPGCCVFTSHFLVSASSSGDFSAQVLSGWRLPSNYLFSSSENRTELTFNWLGCPSCLPYNSLARLAQTTPFILVSVAGGTCLPSRSLDAAICSCLLRICCLGTDVVMLSVSQPLPRNECCFRAVR